MKSPEHFAMEACMVWCGSAVAACYLSLKSKRVVLRAGVLFDQGVSEKSRRAHLSLLEP